MTGITFPSPGPASAATQTVWFGAIVDRLNMLMPYNYPTVNTTSNIPAHYGNLHTPFNGSFTTTTTAPDGTTANSQLFVPDTTNNEHYIQAGTFFDNCIAGNSQVIGPIRLVGIFKAGGYTRVGFNLNMPQGTQSMNYQVVFDLAGAQVGVPASFVNNGGAFGNTSYVQLLGTQVVALPASFGGGGWVMCIQDAYWKDGQTNFLVATTFVDAGSGTGALNNVFAGNGTSGIYVWRTNLMPLAAWGISSVTFLDDFNSISTIDVNNTLAPGYNWYPNHTWVGYLNPVPAFPAGQIAVAGSVLTLTGPDDVSLFGLVSAGVTNAAAGTFVGRGFGANRATLYEIKASWSYSTTFAPFGPPNPALTWFTADLEWAVSQGTSNRSDHGREFDMMEAAGLSRNDTACLAYVGAPASGPGPVSIASLGQGVQQASIGIPSWYSGFNYTGNGNDLVLSGGTPYFNISSSGNTGHMPPNATYWASGAYPGSVKQAIIPVDYTQMHVYSVLVIPFWGQPTIPGQPVGIGQQASFKAPNFNSTLPGVIPDMATGLKMSFFDGAMCNISATWGPNQIAPSGSGPNIGSYLFNSDNQNLMHMLSPGLTTGLTYNIDYFQVIQ